MKKALLGLVIILGFSTIATAETNFNRNQYEKSLENMSRLRLFLEGAKTASSVATFCAIEGNVAFWSAVADTLPGTAAIPDILGAGGDLAFEAQLDWEFQFDSILGGVAEVNATAWGAMAVIQDLLVMFANYGITTEFYGDTNYPRPFHYIRANYAVTKDIFKHMFSTDSACGLDAQKFLSVLYEYETRNKAENIYRDMTLPLMP